MVITRSATEHVLRWLVALPLAVLAGCVTAPDVPRPQELAGTEWVLIDYKLSSDEAARDVPLNKYKLQLDRSGQATFVLDCNRASASWAASASAVGSGELRFSKVAATMALCTDDGLGERLGREVGPVSKYAIYDGRLTITSSTGTAWTFDTVD